MLVNEAVAEEERSSANTKKRKRGEISGTRSVLLLVYSV